MNRYEQHRQIDNIYALMHRVKRTNLNRLDVNTINGMLLDKLLEEARSALYEIQEQLEHAEQSQEQLEQIVRATKNRLYETQEQLEQEQEKYRQEVKKSLCREFEFCTAIIKAQAGRR